MAKLKFSLTEKEIHHFITDFPDKETMDKLKEIRKSFRPKKRNGELIMY